MKVISREWWEMFRDENSKLNMFLIRMVGDV